MKPKIFLLVGVLVLFISCGRENVGLSSCYLGYDESIRGTESDYQYYITNVTDSEGLSNSCEACKLRRQNTYDYIVFLEDRKQEIVENISAVLQMK